MSNLIKRYKSFIFILFLLVSIKKSYALTWHVIDWGNLAKNAAILEESIRQTKQQIDNYRLHLEQMKLMVKNITKPNRFIWDDIQSSINNINYSIRTLRSYKEKLGGIQEFLDEYMSLKDYEKLNPNNPNYQKLIKKHREFTTTVVQQTNDDLLTVTVQQQAKLEKEAIKLRELQGLVKSAEGNLQAISYTNQLMAQQNNQILQMRTAQLAQQAARAAKQRAEADEKAQRIAEFNRLNDMSEWKAYNGPSAWLDFD